MALPTPAPSILSTIRSDDLSGHIYLDEPISDDEQFWPAGWKSATSRAATVPAPKEPELVARRRRGEPLFRRPRRGQ